MGNDKSSFREDKIKIIIAGTFKPHPLGYSFKAED